MSGLNNKKSIIFSQTSAGDGTPVGLDYRHTHRQEIVVYCSMASNSDTINIQVSPSISGNRWATVATYATTAAQADTINGQWKRARASKTGANGAAYVALVGTYGDGKED